MRAPAVAIAAFVRGRNGASSSEILERFQLSEATLRRRRRELQRLGVVFVERGHGSFYVPAELRGQIPAKSRAEGRNPDTVGHSVAAAGVQPPAWPRVPRL